VSWAHLRPGLIGCSLCQAAALSAAAFVRQRPLAAALQPAACQQRLDPEMAQDVFDIGEIPLAAVCSTCLGHMRLIRLAVLPLSVSGLYMVKTVGFTHQQPPIIGLLCALHLFQSIGNPLKESCDAAARYCRSLAHSTAAKRACPIRHELKVASNPKTPGRFMRQGDPHWCLRNGFHAFRQKLCPCSLEIGSRFLGRS